MERKLIYKKTEYCVRFTRLLPFLTPSQIAKYLYSEYYVKNRTESYKLADATLRRLHKQKRINRAFRSNEAIYVSIGKTKRVGLKYFFHNQALGNLIIKTDIFGYKAKYGGLNSKFPNADAVAWVKGKLVAIELDTGSNGPKALHEQVMKYEGSPFDYILYVTYPDSHYFRGDDENIDQQAEQEKDLRRKIKTHKIPYELKQKVLSTTYAQASEPFTDMYTEKIWRTLNGSYRTVL